MIVLTNIAAQAKSLLHSQQQAERGFGLYAKSEKKEFMFFKQEGANPTLRDKPLKLVDQFTYLGNNISSTESNVNIWIGETWSDFESLLIV